MINPYEVARNLIGLSEIPGPEDNYFILWCLSLCGLPKSMMHDETAWCSALINGCMKISGLPPTRSAAARSWLTWGIPVALENIQVGDLLIFKRGDGPQPGPEVLDAPGHVGFYPGTRTEKTIACLAGNQGNRISVSMLPIENILGIRRAA